MNIHITVCLYLNQINGYTLSKILSKPLRLTANDKYLLSDSRTFTLFILKYDKNNNLSIDLYKYFKTDKLLNNNYSKLK